ncbi:MAG: alanyl-tRNA editing protein [Proteocatella sp.]
MVKTIKLFENSSYITKFNATVLNCLGVEADDKNFEKYNYKIVLDKTAFYPEGGGQPSDKGCLLPIKISKSLDVESKTFLEVLDVKEKDGVIYHYVNFPLEEGCVVEGKIDWNFRFMLMQHHTGEHIVSGLINRHYGFSNVGFHMGEHNVSIDFDGKLSDENLNFIEWQANNIVYKNLGIKIDFPVPDELDLLNYRSKKIIDGEIRIVSVPSADVCACCGTHVKYTGEVGIIKLISSQNYKGGTRIFMLCGKKALYDYNQKNEILSEIASQLSSKPETAMIYLAKLKADRARLKSENNSLLDTIFELKAESIDKNLKKVILFEENLTTFDLMRFSSHLTKDRDGIIFLFSGNDEDGYKYLISSVTLDIKFISENFNKTFGAKGGGKSNCIQGNVIALRKDIEAYFEPFDFNFVMNL